MNFRASSRFVPLDIVTLMNRYVPRLVAAVTEGCEAVTAEAKALCPVDTGELQASIHVDPAGPVGTVIIGSVVADAPHAAYVEFGTGIRGSESPGAGVGPYSPNWPGMPAIPFLRPALDNSRSAILSAYAEHGLRVL